MILFIRKRWLIILMILSLSIGFSMHSTRFQSSAAPNSIPNGPDNSPAYTKLAAHACGAYKGMTFTNSLNALNANYKKGFRLFEIDFNYTSDHHIVLIHDWWSTEQKLLGPRGEHYSYNKFKKAKTTGNLTLMDTDALVSWLAAHNDAYVITDCKGDNLAMLKDISIRYKNMLQRFLPQMGPFGEYASLRQMGYSNIILALYKTNYTDDEILRFVKSHGLFAVSMEAKRSETDLTPELGKLNIKVYAHTVNSPSLYKQLLEHGVYGIYTDFLAPDTNH